MMITQFTYVNVIIKHYKTWLHIYLFVKTQASYTVHIIQTNLAYTA
jgi:hypothetical protein